MFKLGNRESNRRYATCFNVEIKTRPGDRFTRMVNFGQGGNGMYGGYGNMKPSPYEWPDEDYFVKTIRKLKDEGITMDMINQFWEPKAGSGIPNPDVPARPKVVVSDTNPSAPFKYSTKYHTEVHVNFLGIEKGSIRAHELFNKPDAENIDWNLLGTDVQCPLAEECAVCQDKEEEETPTMNMNGSSSASSSSSSSSSSSTGFGFGGHNHFNNNGFGGHNHLDNSSNNLNKDRGGIQLTNFCKHIFHKSCLKEWFKKGILVS